MKWCADSGHGIVVFECLWVIVVCRVVYRVLKKWFHELIAILPMFRHTYRITVVKWECMLDAPDMKSSVYE